MTAIATRRKTRKPPRREALCISASALRQFEQTSRCARLRSGRRSSARARSTGSQAGPPDELELEQCGAALTDEARVRRLVYPLLICSLVHSLDLRAIMPRLLVADNPPVSPARLRIGLLRKNAGVTQTTK